MDKLQVRLVGISPLLMHNPAGSMMLPGPKSPSERIPTPENEAERGTYRNEAGSLVFPALAVRSCLLAGSIGYKIGRRSAKAIIAGALYNVASPLGNSEWLDLLDCNGMPLVKYTIDTRRAVVQRGGISRSRPRLDEWTIEVDIVYDEQFVVGEVLLEALKRAGMLVGLGDFRPERGGPFGRFRVELRNE